MATPRRIQDIETYPKSETELPHTVLPAKFNISQEVFILDTNGSDPAGLTTYVVISNNEIDINSGQRHYRLRPLPSGPFRAVETRLMEVGHALGAEVIRPFDTMPSVVIKRYVKNGARFYIIKDTLDTTAANVAEWEIQPHVGGMFPSVHKAV